MNLRVTYPQMTEPITDTRHDGVRMLLPEDLSRIRSNELLAEAHRQRLVRSVTAGRYWSKLADFAARRARHATGGS